MKTLILVTLMSVFTLEGIQSKIEGSKSDDTEITINNYPIVDSMKNTEQNDPYIYKEVQQAQAQNNVSPDTASPQEESFIDGAFRCRGVNIILSNKL